MWLYRGAQSAVFYYATCTPCAEGIDRRKRRKDAVRTQRLKEKHDPDIVTDQPRLFPQPTPFSTNEGWDQEIALGPGPPARRHRKIPRTDSWNTDQSSQLKKDKSGGLMHPIAERWKRYQREDEPLWGQDYDSDWGQEVRGSSIGFSGRGRAIQEEPSKYYMPRPAPINDIHPPIVSGPISRADTRWMLQPPPSAKVMAGKERFPTSPRDSTGGFARDRTSRMSRQGPLIEENRSGPADRTIDETVDQLPRRPSASRGRGHSKTSEELDEPPFSRADSMSSLANSDDQSFTTSWKYPDTPGTRPASKSTDGSEKVYARPQISKTLSTIQRGDKQKFQCLQLEINDDTREEVGLGQLEPIRPWRWSMDI
ncbi:hypothetical protein N7509_007159 [Penicillium cosmopolitanum]|uniref:Uncharacterized protein n=1 Tax=Penicillium cosmopolitanum TaxID=1131564 RepID=A0A9X0B844_9EURO|nr:uncharacterized protein N7509_007159 [Penicillium cosmopolitanum]KAJ5391669.1 hypothetical protein N7509_007159 [Penicillium cosmopolitanum]